MVESIWIRPGTHINALGADAEGKQEIESTVLSRARVFVDDREQAAHSGEINVPLHKHAWALTSLSGTLRRGRCRPRKGTQLRRRYYVVRFDRTCRARRCASACYL